MVSASVSAGFLAVFTVLGFVIRAGGDGVADVIRYLSIVIGFVLIGLGVAFLLGRSLAFATPRLDRGGRSRTFWSMFVFGISYAVASFGCTIGPFVLTVLGSFTRDGTASGVLMIVAYGLGMGLLLTTLTVTLALARGGLLRGSALGPAVDRQRRRGAADPRRPLPRLLLVVRPGVGHRRRGTWPAAVSAPGSSSEPTTSPCWLNDRGAGFARPRPRRGRRGCARRRRGVPAAKA